MTILPVVVVCAVVLVAAYVTYGRLVSRWLGLDGTRRTPAMLEAGGDFAPAPAPIVLGGHFTAIAAAGPVVGPILAGLAFGWVPALLWIVIGSIFIGGVHDAGSLFASLRHGAGSITKVVRDHLTRPAYVTFLVFVWISLVYVIIAFADVTAGSFAKFHQLPVMIDGSVTNFTINGGAVAVGATAYLVLSVLMGLALRYTKAPWWALLVVCVVLLGLTIWLSDGIAAWLASHGLSFMQTASGDPGQLTRGWHQALLAYCFIASLVPMWALLQPRGMIGAAFLYASLFFGMAGTLIGGWSSSGSLAIQWPAFTGWTGTGGALLFPFLFITIACGACSGFHSIVASGTTSKQVRSELDVKPVAYGGMLLEAMVAIFALSCVMVMVPGQATAGSPDAIYARGIGNFMNLCGIPMHFAVGFGLLAFSSFIFDTLDVCTRLGRYIVQEMLGVRGLAGGAIATLLTLGGPSYYLWMMPPGSFRTYWLIFGTSNQLLAALTLVCLSVWLWRTGRPVWFALAPALFMIASTATALVLNFRDFLGKYQVSHEGTQIANMTIAAVLLLLGALVTFEALRVWRRSRLQPVVVEA
jgi:carbon starvation protein